MKDASEKIVFTGTGIVCGAGGTVEDVWEKLEKGETCVGPFEQFDASNWPVQVASEVTLDKRTLVPERKLHKTISRTDMVGIYASERAIENSGILDHREGLGEDEVDAFNDRTGLIVGMAESMAKATSVIMVSDAIMGKAISPP